MNWQQARFFTAGLALGLLMALSPSCGKKCGPDNCKDGCCAKDTCVKPASDAQCGASGGACSACATGTTCQSGVCKEVIVPDDGGMDGGDSGVVDAGPPPCMHDDDCAALMNATRCDETSGKCIPGTQCSVQVGDSQCQTGDVNDYCYQYGTQCRCEADQGAADSGLGGVCRRRHVVCEECTSDDQCGDTLVFDPVGACQQLQGDSSGKKYCLEQITGSCPCGMVENGNGYCEPQSHSCDQVGCSLDKDCPSGSVCNSARCLCEPRCRWDFAKQAVVPGCPPGQTCWVDEQNMDPTSLYFGAGRCRPPCTSDSDCDTADAGNPFGGPKLKCGTEQLMGGGMSDKRCRGNGECMDDLECPVQPVDSPYNGFCNRSSLSCEGMSCREGTDPVTGVPYKDCRIPYACAPGDAGTGANICRLLTCVEQGGAIIACRQGQYCCGEDKDQDGKPDPCPPPQQLGPDNCYDAPVPPFCSTCMSNDDCTNLQLPAYLTGNGACANGSHSPNCSPMPYICIQETMNTNVCAVPTWNDGTTIAGSHTNHAALGCPVNYPTQLIRPQLAAQGSNTGQPFCDNDNDCDVGTDAGRCSVDNSAGTLMDGGKVKACVCSVGVPGTCPNDPDSGITSECRYGITGQTVPCVTAVVCLPGQNILFQDAGPPKYGCGLMP